MRVHVDHFAREIEIRDELAAHGSGFQLPDTDTAAGDDGLLHRARRAHGERKRLQHLNQALALDRGDLAAGQGGGDSAQLGEQLRQAGRQQGSELIPQELFAGRGEIPQDPGIQLISGETGLQVDLQGSAFRRIRQMAAGFQHDRAGDAEMRKEHFAEF